MTDSRMDFSKRDRATRALPVGLPALILSIMISAEARRKLVELLRVMRCGGCRALAANIA